MSAPAHFRILVVDDQPAIHDDFRKILLSPQERDLQMEFAESLIFETPPPAAAGTTFEIDSAQQGQAALAMLEAALAAGTPYALAFVDVRMPPGWDGIETLERMWRVDPALQAVICTAYADFSWAKIAARLHADDNFVILKKPFDNIEVMQLAHALTKKWILSRHAQMQLDTLEQLVHDRTRELETANAELRRSEERFAAAFRASPAPLAIQTFDEQRFVDVNDAFLRMTGYGREELVGRTPMELSLCIDYVAAADRGRVANATAQISTRNGEIRHALVSIERITIAGEPHILLMAEDVSDRVRLEEQLRQAQKMEAIGQLAAGIAHDFNNLLTIIQGHTSLQMAIGGFGPDLAASLREIEHASERAAELTRQLLAFSRRQIMRPRVLDLSEHIQKLSTMLRRLIGEQIELCFGLPAGIPSVLADPTNIEQVVINLAVNARDAMPRGGRLTIETCGASFSEIDCERNPEALPGEYVVLTVADTGMGMDERTRSRIFEPFFTTKEVHKGTGMGLATVYGIARQHGGWVSVETAPERGSIFRVYLPVTARSAEPMEKPASKGAPPRREHTILLAEDDDAVRGLVREVLLHHRYRVLEAGHAAAALTLWEQHADEIELLLTDVVMPGELNGLDLARRLLADKPELKVIYTSGYSTELFASDLRLQDGTNYLPKPYLSSKLTTMLRAALEPEEGAG